MLTSEFKSFPLTLLEAQQFAVLPIVFDSFGSVVDIIENNKNGILIPYSDIELFVNNMRNLMNNVRNRKDMAVESVAMSAKFSKQQILKKWNCLFYKILR